MKITRRAHMYLGLLLVPWVVLFGLRGFLFNNNSTFWGGNIETVATFPSADVLDQGEIQALDFDHEMERVLDKINRASDSDYTLKGSPWLSGHLSLTGQAGKKASLPR